MMWIQDIISIPELYQIGSIITSFLIIITPIFYPRYSLFVKRGHTGIQKLQTTREETENIQAGYLEKGDTGYSEVKKVVKEVYGVNRELHKIWFVIGEKPPHIGEFADLDIQYGVGSNAVLYGENPGDETFKIHYEAWSPPRVWNLEALYEGLESIAQSRSHYIMMVLAVLWSTLSILSTI